MNLITSLTDRAEEDVSTVFNGVQPETDALRDQNGRFVAGSKQGRPKGAISEATKLKDRLLRTIEKLDAMEEYQGDYLLWFAEKFPERFLSLVVSLLPRQIKVESDHLHAHVAVMDLPEADRAKLFAECRMRIIEVGGGDGCRQLPLAVKQRERKEAVTKIQGSQENHQARKR